MEGQVEGKRGEVCSYSKEEKMPTGRFPARWSGDVNDVSTILSYLIVSWFNTGIAPLGVKFIV